MARSTTTDADLRRDYWNATLAWANAKGDWRDSTGAAQGTSAHSGCAVTVTDTDSTKTTVFDLTALAAAESWFSNADRTCAVICVADTNNHHYCTKEHATPANRPSLVYSYTDATSDTFWPVADAQLSSSSAGSLGALTSVEILGGTDNFCLLFPPPAKALTSVTLTMTTTAQFGGPQTLSVYQVAVPGEAPPAAAAPDAPTAIVASLIGATTFTAGWTAPASGGAVANYEIEVRKRATSSASLGTYAAATGSPVGAVLSLAISDATLNGQLAQFRVRATNATGDSAWVESSEFWMINASTSGGGELPVGSGGGGGTAPTITSADAASCVAGTAFSFTPTATGSGTMTWSATGLPSGFIINSATGEVTGPTSVVGALSWSLTAANGTLPNAAQAFTLNVTAPVTARRLRTLITVSGLPAAGYFVSFLLLNAAKLEDVTGVVVNGTATLDAFGYLDVLFASALPPGAVLHLTVDTSEGIAGIASNRSYNAPIALL